eukprot:9466899-Pyramimonas_sp.AAC.1
MSWLKNKRTQKPEKKKQAWQTELDDKSEDETEAVLGEVDADEVRATRLLMHQRIYSVACVYMSLHLPMVPSRDRPPVR